MLPLIDDFALPLCERSGDVANRNIVVILSGQHTGISADTTSLFSRKQQEKIPQKSADKHLFQCYRVKHGRKSCRQQNIPKRTIKRNGGALRPKMAAALLLVLFREIWGWDHNPKQLNNQQRGSHRRSGNAHGARDDLVETSCHGWGCKQSRPLPRAVRAATLCPRCPHRRGASCKYGGKENPSDYTSDYKRQKFEFQIFIVTKPPVTRKSS